MAGLAIGLTGLLAVRRLALLAVLPGLTLRLTVLSRLALRLAVLTVLTGLTLGLAVVPRLSLRLTVRRTERLLRRLLAVRSALRGLTELARLRLAGLRLARLRLPSGCAEGRLSGLLAVGRTRRLRLLGCVGLLGRLRLRGLLRLAIR